MSLVLRIFLFVLAISLITGMRATTSAQSMHQAGGSYIPQRVFNSVDKRFGDFESMLAELSLADIIFVGEQHDDPATHRLERAILEGVTRRRGNVIVAMEMFERDVQPKLDDYLTGKITEEEFLQNSRPWPRYLTDYRPIVEFARLHGWRVIGSNVPRRFASQVSKQGLASIDAVPTVERKLIAEQIECPIDDYFQRFSETMNGHPGPHRNQQDKADNPDQRAIIERFYLAQCIKDETMAESIVEQLKPQSASQPKPLVVHFNGAFHSDYRLGAVSRANRRSPQSKIKVVTVVPVENLDSIKPDDYAKRGDYIVFALRPAER